MYMKRSTVVLFPAALLVLLPGALARCRSYLALNNATEATRFKAYCSVEEILASSGCLCHLRVINVVRPFGKGPGQKREYCTAFGDLYTAKKYCRYLDKPPRSVFATLVWLDNLSRYCYGGSILPELGGDSPFRPFFKVIEAGARSPAIPDVLLKELKAD